MTRWIVIAACVACSTPYQPMGTRGGYQDVRTAVGTYVVYVRVRWGATQGTAIIYAHRRAGELCPSGYQIMSQVLTGEDQVTLAVRCDVQ